MEQQLAHGCVQVCLLPGLNHLPALQTDQNQDGVGGGAEQAGPDPGEPQGYVLVPADGEEASPPR